tara:strand:- start:371 stop:664 length:294 start_codon:yes stop_codon:yes gene_type:complete
LREFRKSAIAIKNIKEAGGNACLYRLSDPLMGYEYVVVSAVKSRLTDLDGECLIFGSDNTGKIKSFLELPGSYSGGMAHDKALNDAGYDINFGESFK